MEPPQPFPLFQVMIGIMLAREQKHPLSLIQKFKGGPVGLETLAASISEEKDTREDVYEPFLIQSGLLNRTPRGRVATLAAFEHFGIHPSKTDRQEFLF